MVDETGDLPSAPPLCVHHARLLPKRKNLQAFEHRLFHIKLLENIFKRVVLCQGTVPISGHKLVSELCFRGVTK